MNTIRRLWAKVLGAVSARLGGREQGGEIYNVSAHKTSVVGYKEISDKMTRKKKDNR